MSAPEPSDASAPPASRQPSSNPPPQSPVSHPAASISDRDRYSRQVLFPGIGTSGQDLLRQARVAVVGVGATGAAAASLLARAGVGHLTLIDRDFVEPSNLQRQMLFDEADALASLPKAEAARRHLALINSSVEVIPHIADLVPANAADLLAGADILLDCTDNFETRYLLNDLCVRDARPWIYAAAVGAYAATMNILPRPAVESNNKPQPDPHWLPTATSEPTAAQSCLPSTLYPLPSVLPTACLACIFPSAPTGNLDTCETAGILSTAVNLAASIQVTEALKFLTRQPHLMRRSLLSFDLWTPQARGTLTRSEISTDHPRADCDVCGHRHFHALSGEQRPHITLCGRNSVQIHEHHRPLDLPALQQRLSPIAQIQNLRANGLLLRFDYPPYTLTAFPDGRALIQGTTDIGLARSLYARFLGS
jgi:molybdopterin/thiamine biosynthesis adenylyltransferase